MDVLEAPSIGRKRNGALPEAWILLWRGAQNLGVLGLWGCCECEPRLVMLELSCVLGCCPLVWMLG